MQVPIYVYPASIARALLHLSFESIWYKVRISKFEKIHSLLFLLVRKNWSNLDPNKMDSCQFYKNEEKRGDDSWKLHSQLIIIYAVHRVIIKGKIYIH